MVKSTVQVRRILPAIFVFALTSSVAFGAVRRNAQQTAPGSRPGTPAADSPTTAGIAIDAGDLLVIDVFDVPQLSGKYRVHSDGEIDVPLLGKPIHAAGLSAEQLAAALAEELRSSGLVSHPQVTVDIEESQARSVTVAGAVKKPEMIPVFGRTTLLDAISEAGGLAENAGSIATITRGKPALAALEAAGGAGALASRRRRVVSVDLRRLMETGDPDLNPQVFPGDRVLVEPAGVIYVVGAVNRAGGFLLTGDRGPMTLLKAIALAEGLKSTAVANRALILRPSGESRAQVPVRLKDVLTGRAPDQRLQANDILFVPDSNSQKAIRRGAEAAVEIATGIMIWRL